MMKALPKTAPAFGEVIVVEERSCGERDVRVRPAWSAMGGVPAR